MLSELLENPGYGQGMNLRQETAPEVRTGSQAVSDLPTAEAEELWTGVAIDPNGNEIDLGGYGSRAEAETEARRVATSWGVEVWLYEVIRHEITDVKYWHEKDGNVQ